MSEFWGITLLVIALVTTLPSVVSCFVRFRDESVTGPRVSLCSTINTALAMICAVAGILCATQTSLNGSQQGETSFDIDRVSLTFLYVASMLGKLSICLSLWPLISKSLDWKRIFRIEITLIALVNPLWSLITFLRCHPVNDVPQLSLLPNECFNKDGVHNLDYAQIALELAMPVLLALILCVMAVKVPRNVRGPFYALLSLLAIITGLVAMRIYHIELLRSGNISVPRTIVEIYGIVEANASIIAANIIPIISHRPKLIDPIIRTLNQNTDESGNNISLDSFPGGFPTFAM
ncbi:hypothetical protein F5Y04DRAFT_280690 [Hypomontagnella monticulosa]|nr:hypothetical protein F5Y04DRAFT_280690 [Hypomontagnella monticulosa]